MKASASRRGLSDWPKDRIFRDVKGSVAINVLKRLEQMKVTVNSCLVSGHEVGVL